MERASILSVMFIWLTLLSGCAPAASANVTGLYLAENETKLEVIQLVEQADGTLAGRLEYYAIKDDGRLESHSRALSGSARDGDLVLKLDRSLETLFTSTALSGRVKGNALQLIGEGGAGRYRRSDMSERNKILDRLNEQIRLIQWNIVVEHNRQIFSQIKSDVADIEAQMPKIRARIESAHKDYKSQISEIEKRENQIVRLETMDYRYVGNQRHQLKTEVYNIQSGIYRLGTDIDRLSANLDSRLSAIKQKSGDVFTFCEQYESAPDQLEFCADIPALKLTFNGIILDLTGEFDAWDELIGRN